MVKILVKLYQNSSENRTWDVLVKTKQNKAKQNKTKKATITYLKKKKILSPQN